MLRSLIVAGLVLGLLAGGTGTAAADSRFDLWTTTEYTPGRAHAYGTIVFGGGVTVRGRINDVCPGDAHGAYLRVTAVFENGKTRQATAKDTSGCNNPDGVNFTINLDAVQPSNGVVAVRLHLYEYDAERHSVADTTDRTFRR